MIAGYGLGQWRRQQAAGTELLHHGRFSSVMLACPSCGNSDPKRIYLSLSFEGDLANDLMRNAPSPEAVKAYVLEAVWGEHSEVECHVCWYHGPWVAAEYCSDSARAE